MVAWCMVEIEEEPAAAAPALMQWEGNAHLGGLHLLPHAQALASIMFK